MRMLSAAMTVITVGCVLPCCRSRGSSDADAKSELVALEREAATDYLKRDTAFFNRFFADDWSGLNSDGSTEGKAKALADIGSPGYNTESLQLDVTNVRVLGETAIVTLAVTTKMTFNGKDLSGKY